MEIPIGPNNRIEPGGPDYGQPTVFEPGRQKTVFAIKVPKDFGAKKLTWTLVANGQPAVVTFHLQPRLQPELLQGRGERQRAAADEVRRQRAGDDRPAAGFAQTLTGSVGQPVPLKLWASDAPPLEKNWESIVASRTRSPRGAPRDQVAIVNGQVIGAGGGRARQQRCSRPDITVIWTKMRGPGDVTVTPPRVPLVTKADRNCRRRSGRRRDVLCARRVRAARRAGRSGRRRRRPLLLHLREREGDPWSRASSGGRPCRCDAPVLATYIQSYLSTRSARQPALTVADRLVLLKGRTSLGRLGVDSCLPSCSF